MSQHKIEYRNGELLKVWNDDGTVKGMSLVRYLFVDDEFAKALNPKDITEQEYREIAEEFTNQLLIERDEAKSERNQLRKALADKEKELQGQAAEIERLTAHTADYETKSQQNKQFTDEQVALRREIEQLKNSAEETRSLHKTHLQVKRELEELKAKLDGE